MSEEGVKKVVATCGGSDKDKVGGDTARGSNATGVAPSPKRKRVSKSEIRRLKKELEDLQVALSERDKALEDQVTRMKYLQAEFENYRKMVERERGEIVKTANERLITGLLDVYESLVLGIEAAKNSDDKESLLEGLELIYKKLDGILERAGLEPIMATKEKFDPFKHEAVLTEERDDMEEGIVLEELQRGYTLNRKVIRYSKVKVSRREKKDNN